MLSGLTSDCTSRPAAAGLGTSCLAGAASVEAARFFGTHVESWMNLQAHYDIECAQAEVGRSLTRIKPFQRPLQQATA